MADAGFDITRAKPSATCRMDFSATAMALINSGSEGMAREAEIRTVRAAAAQAILPEGALVAPHQIHSPDVLDVSTGWDDSAEGRPVADGLVTATPGLVLGIVTADCAPVLFADTNAGVIGAAHAGWRGAHGGVLEKTVEAMERLGPNRGNIAVVIGPTIAQPSYEVDDAFRLQFDEGDAACFSPGREGHWQFDLPRYIGARLSRADVASIDNLALDTYSLESRYYSYRRATHRGEPNYGRQLSLIALG